MSFALAYGCAVGLVLHQWFKRHEPSISSAPLTIAGADVVVAAVIDRMHFDVGLSGIKLLATLSATTVASLLLSIAVYRLSPWHPLASYPGSILHKLSQLRTGWASWRGTHYRDIERLHKQYGPVVRIGPNVLSIVDVAAVNAVYALPKDRFYQAKRPAGICTLLAMSPGPEHTQRRKLWNRGLGQSALSTHVQSAAEGWERFRAKLNHLADQKQTVDISMWLRFYGFDFMGHIAFGKEFGLVQAGADEIGAWAISKDFLFTHEVIGHISWLGSQASHIPTLYNGLLNLRKFARRCVVDRLQRPATTLDLWYYLGAEDDEDKTRKPLRLEQQAAEAALVIIAGADTTATSMIFAIYLLLSHPDCFARAQAEVDAAAALGLTPWSNAECHSALPYLSACMDESLRLFPVIMTNGSRSVPSGSGGKMIAGYFVPEETEVFVSPYHMHRDPRYFSPEPESFRPQRWLESDWNTTREAFIPFSAGPSQCVGKQVARIEIVLVLSGLLRHFDITFDNGYDSKTFVQQITEHVVADVPPLPIQLVRRV